MLSALVPPGSVAVDAGANRGLYTYWIARRSSAVHSFEPITACADYMRRARLPRVHVHAAALSAADGVASLWVPELEGEASLSPRVGGEPIEVQAIALDSLRLDNVGFVKIDVEGHELEVLEGAARTIRDQRPLLFIEIEQRHHPGQPVEEVIDRVLGLGYAGASFLLGGTWHSLSEFDAATHQIAEQHDVSGGRYGCNFLFSPRGGSSGEAEPGSAER